MSKDKTTAKGCLVMLVTAPLTALLNGYALATLWRWFVIPQFHLPALSIGCAIGFSIFVRLITYQSDASYSDLDKSDVERMINAVIAAFLLPSLSLGFGWIVLKFIS